MAYHPLTELIWGNVVRITTFSSGSQQIRGSKDEVEYAIRRWLSTKAEGWPEFWRSQVYGMFQSIRNPDRVGALKKHLELTEAEKHCQACGAGVQKNWVETKPGTVFCSTRCAFPDTSVDGVVQLRRECEALRRALDISKEQNQNQKHWINELGQTIRALKERSNAGPYMRLLKRNEELRAELDAEKENVAKLSEQLETRDAYHDMQIKIDSLEADLVLKDGELNGKDLQIQSLKEASKGYEFLQKRLDEVVAYRDKAEKKVEQLEQFWKKECRLSFSLRDLLKNLLAALAPFRQTIAPDIHDPETMMWAKLDGYRNWSNLHKVWGQVEQFLMGHNPKKENVTMTITKVCSNPCGAARWSPELGVWKTKLIQGVVYFDNGDFCPKCGKELR